MSSMDSVYQIEKWFWVGTSGLSSDKIIIERTDLLVVEVDDSTGGITPTAQTQSPQVISD